ncbi:MAG: DUF3536 domain-containing protein [Chloroflexi bacterium]|nr:DUF3536 domain-containing protein [Chloroflexota bacterium]
MQYCIHGHFYQPPREDPISNYIPDEIGAEPFRNWNERILAECYAPNAASANFAKISFNIGPTLFRWMESAYPDVYQSVIDQERSNYIQFHAGNGMAQAYNHTILPLASKLDKITQIRWGVKDFEYRFGHLPAGMWMPETAADMETLCVMSDAGLSFTILSPWQVKPLTVQPGPYLIPLPGSRKPFIVFTYDRDVSTQISFIPSATADGDRFLNNLNKSFGSTPDGLRLFASDGELYGHHQHFRDYFLTYILNGGGVRHGIEWTWPERWLKTNQVKAIADLNERTSWSCLHGVERWAGTCDCTPDSDWKKPMRFALNQLERWLDDVYLTALNYYFEDAWELRHRYIDVMDNQLTLRQLVNQLTIAEISEAELTRIDLLLKAQYERQRMYTSCGFFFDEFHRIEPQNSIAYAANSVWLTKKATGRELPREIMELFKLVRSKKTGLRADTVFSQTLIRAQAED